jgi:hypothetical protein
MASSITTDRMNFHLRFDSVDLPPAAGAASFVSAPAGTEHPSFKRLA